MANRYDRKNFFGTMTDDNDIVLTDPIQYDFQEFLEFMRNKNVRVIRLEEHNAYAPELISYLEFGTHEFWWVICYLNKIQDPINELEPGIEIAIPFLSDIEEFRQSRTSASTRGQSVILR